MNTSIDTELLPTDEEIKDYHSSGYYVSKKIFGDDELDAAIFASEEYYASLKTREIPLPNDRTYSLAWYLEDGQNSLRKNDFSTLIVPELRSLLEKPEIGAIAALLCGEDVRLWHDQLLYKPPSKPSTPVGVGWHTDAGYWRTCSSKNMLTAWIPFTDMNIAIGTISFIKNSLHWPDNDHLDFFSSDLKGLEELFNTGGDSVVKVPAILKRGQVTFHHCRTIHGSSPNTTAEPRRSIAMHLQPASNTYKRIVENDKLVSHPNDYLTLDRNGKPNYSDPIYCPVVGNINNAKRAQSGRN